MNKNRLLLAIGLVSVWMLGACERESYVTIAPTLYFTLVDSSNTSQAVLTAENVDKVELLYNQGRVENLLKYRQDLTPVGPSNDKFTGRYLISSQALLAYSQNVDSLAYQLILANRRLGTIRLKTFKRPVDNDPWRYVSELTFNGKVIPPTGESGEVYVIPVTR